MNGYRVSSKSLGSSYLEEAVLDIDRRSVNLRHALEQIIHAVPAVGSALIRPCTEGDTLWQVEYAGTRRNGMQRWLSTHLDTPTEDMSHILQEKPPHLPDTMPVLFRLHPRSPPLNGFWILWSHTDFAPALDDGELDSFRKNLEALLEIEYKEQLYFHSPHASLDPELKEVVANGDSQGLPALLTIARLTTNADLTYWGEVRNDVVEVEWNLGAKNSGFGFELPVGQGVGGRAFGEQEIFWIPDYRNCRYRYPGVSDVCDRQEIRSKLAVPVRSPSSRVGAVLYVARRTVDPFSISDCLLLRRLARGIGSVPDGKLTSHYFFPSTTGQYLTERKSELRQILLDSSHVGDVEAWVEKFVKGPAILVDAEERPYVPSNVDRLERIQYSSTSHKTDFQTIPLTQSGVNRRSHLCIWPSVSLPPEEWPDFLEDTAATCNIVLDRMRRVNDRLSHQRSHWLRGVVEGTALQPYHEGHRLGLSIDHGEVWALSWRREEIQDGEQEHLKLLIEDAALDQLGTPLIFLDDNIGVILLGGSRCKAPSTIRDELLKISGPTSLWLVHGAVYNSFDELKHSLLQAITMAKRVRHEDSQSYVLEVSSLGLDGLLADPELSDTLDTFAKNLLEPLLAYDSDKGAQLTETLTLVLTLGSIKEAAKHLYVHVSTVKYRVRRAEQILGRDLNLPTDRTALSLAAFVWDHHYASSSHNGQVTLN